MLARSILVASLALPQALAVSLAAWTPRASNLNSACQKVYQMDINGCTTADFTGGKGCSSACFFGVNVLAGQVKAACAGQGSDSVLSRFLSGTGPSYICPTVQSSASTTDAASQTSQAASTAKQTTQAASSSSTAAAQTSPTDTKTSATVTKTDSTASTSSDSSSARGETTAVSTATLIPVGAGTSTTATTGTSGTQSSTASSSTSATSPGSNGSPFVFNGDSPEPGIKGGAVRESVSGAALAAFVIGAVAFL